MQKWVGISSLHQNYLFFTQVPFHLRILWPVTTDYILYRCLEMRDEQSFNEFALEIFRYQAKEVAVYAQFLDLLKVHPHAIKDYKAIPFLPIEMFKYHRIIPPQLHEEVTFRSSGTTGENRSSHYVHSTELYRKLSAEAFRRIYGEPKEWTFLALLPSYLERNDSSLIYMVKQFMDISPDRQHGFFQNDPIALRLQLHACKERGEKVMLLGVSFALLDLAEMGYPIGESVVVMETGGMKGRREELTREELHQRLKIAFGKDQINSEYGMTELLSQAYSKSNGFFQTPPWMKVIIREVNDPFSYCKTGRTGGINIIDLGNAFSCSFIATQDLGRVHSDMTFEVLGRYDHSEVRGCNLLVTS